MAQYILGRRLAAMLALAGCLLAAACQQPSPDIIDKTAVQGSEGGGGKSAGTNQVGEACHYDPSSRALGSEFSQSFDLYCGSWQQPSGRIFQSKAPIPAGSLYGMAASGSWRAGLEERFNCGAPNQQTLPGGSTSVVLSCTQKSGGWPHLALAENVGNQTFFVDGVPSAAPALTTAMAEISGISTPSAQERATAGELISSAIASKPFGSGDLQDYYRLKRLGDEANDVGEYAEAERAYKAALAIQTRFLNADNPGLAVPLMNQALQISNQNRFTEADRLFARAAALIAKQPDPLLRASLDLYLAEHASNQGNAPLAKSLAAAAEKGFRDLIPASLDARAESTASAYSVAVYNTKSSGLENIADSLFLSPDEQSAIADLAATLWFEAYLSYQSGDYKKAELQANRSRGLLTVTGLNPPGIVPRTMEIAALSAERGGNFSVAQQGLGRAANIFQQSQADKRRAAKTIFLQGRTAFNHNDIEGALGYYRQGSGMLRQEHVGLRNIYVEPYVAAIQEEIALKPADSAKLAAEMFDAFQLIETNETSKMLAEAFARLSAGSGGARTVLRSMQDAQEKLKRLSVQLDFEMNKPLAAQDPKTIDALKKQIAETQAKEKDAEGAVMAASPEYAQIIQADATAESIQKLLHPGEALLSYFVGGQTSYAVLIERETVKAYAVPDGEEDLATKIHALRRTIEPDEAAAQFHLPVFDVRGAHELYQALLGPVHGDIDHLKKLVVVPSGALNALPLEVLVTEKTAPVTDGNYGKVPFLVQKLAVSYIPSPQNFLLLRHNSKPSAAPEPYIGFGDFEPATTAQLTASFPPARCASDLAGLEQLPPLPGTRREVSYVGSKIFSVPSSDIILGADFTKTHLQSIDLTRFRIIHLATHALLPTDLHCRTEPMIVVSVPPDASDADAGFLKFSDILSLKLDADLVILSACNTGPNGKNTGDSLSALARGFFFSGSRGLLVTHWELSDASGPLLTALTLRANLKSQDSAEALRDAKLSLIHEVAARAHQNGNFFTHPFAWAPFVLVGEGNHEGVSS